MRLSASGRWKLWTLLRCRASIAAASPCTLLPARNPLIAYFGPRRQSTSMPPVCACPGRNRVAASRFRLVDVAMNPSDDWFVNSRRARITE